MAREPARRQGLVLNIGGGLLDKLPAILHAADDAEIIVLLETHLAGDARSLGVRVVTCSIIAEKGQGAPQEG